MTSRRNPPGAWRPALAADHRDPIQRKSRSLFLLGIDGLRSSDRIDGWKAIGAHFGRDRSTAMRWAQARGLPVRRIPGGKVATVYALKSELDRWAALNAGSELEAADSAPATVGDATARSDDVGDRARPVSGLLIVLGVVAVLALGVGWAVVARPLVSTPTVSTSPKLPATKEMADLYLQARDDWARRTPVSLARAMASLETVTRREPGFAPAFAALADSFLLASEFGYMADEVSFPKAKEAAKAALKIDPNLAAGHRALGFVQYWWDNDPVASGRSFRRALQLEPNSAQTHFWYGNVLSDNGVHDAAWRELSQARLLEPGSVAIQNDIAWAQWRAGRTREAKAALLNLIRLHPDYSVAHDCLASLKLSEGDYAGYVQSFSAYAALREDPGLIARAADQVRALEQGRAAFERLMLDGAIERADREIGRSLAFAAFVASLAGQRAELIDILKRAENERQVWGASGELLRMNQRWAGDPEVSTLLARRRPPTAE